MKLMANKATRYSASQLLSAWDINLSRLAARIPQSFLGAELARLYSPNEASLIAERIYETYIRDLDTRIWFLAKSFTDLRRRFEELESELERFLEGAELKSLAVNQLTLSFLLKDIAENKSNIEQCSSLIGQCFEKLREDRVLYSDCSQFELELQNIEESYRYFLSSAASLRTRLHWQSGSYETSRRAQFYRAHQAAAQGKPLYRQSSYPQLEQFEAWYLEEYVDHPEHVEIGCLATSSGMAAQMVVENFLLKEALHQGDKILFAGRSHFKTRDQLRKIQGFHLKELHSLDSTSMIEEIITEKPQAVFLEPLSTEKTMFVLNVPRLLKSLSLLELERPLFVVVNTSLTAGGERLFKHFDNNSNRLLHLIGVESLSKYRQFGIDRVHAGMIIAEQHFLGALARQRELTGTMLPDIHLAMLPRLGRQVYDARMKLMQRNANLLASLLERELTGLTSETLIIDYPLMSSHRDWPVASFYDYVGSLLALRFGKSFGQNADHSFELITELVEEAHKFHCELVHGLNFGLDRTRISVGDADNPNPSAFFLRIAVGRETIKDIYLLAKVFARVLNRRLRSSSGEAKIAANA